MSTPTPAYTLVDLTDAQKSTAIANIKLRLGELTAKVFPGQAADGRTIYGKSVQAFLAGVEKKALTTADPKGADDLTAEQKAMVDSLMKDGRVKSSVEMAKLIYPGVTIKNLSREQRATFAYMRERFPDSFSVNEEPVAAAQYEPPDRLQGLIALVNTYVMTGDPNRKMYNPATLKVSDERNLKALMGYMRTYTLKYQASTYDKEVDR